MLRYKLKLGGNRNVWGIAGLEKETREGFAEMVTSESRLKKVRQSGRRANQVTEQLV